MIFEKVWEFSDADALPDNTSAIADNIVDTTASAYDEWNNMVVPLWLIVTVNTVGTGTSAVAKVYQHSTTTITSGDLLLTGPILTVANQSASARNDGHYLLVVPVLTIMAAAAAMSGQDRYWGLVYTASGTMTDGSVDAYIAATDHPPIPTTQVLVNSDF